MTKKIFGSLTILILLFTSACIKDKDLLTENPSTFYTLDNAFTTSAQVNSALIALYAQHRDMLTTNPDASISANGSYLWRGNGTDVMDVAYSNIGSSLTNYSYVSSTLPDIQNLFDSWYKLISKANLVIQGANLPGINFSSPQEKSYVLAQARFFRAFAHMNLAELWGGVPIVNEVYSQPNYSFKRETRDDVYQFAINELLAIEPDLPITTPAGGRIVQGVAQHFLCELYLALGTQLASEGKSSEAQSAFANSITYGNKVINGGTYNLMSSRFGTRTSETSVSIDVYNNGSFTPSAKVDTVLFKPNFYWDLFQEGNVNYQEGNRECVWAVQIDYNAFKAEDKLSALPYPRNYGPALRDGSSGNLTGLLEEVGGRGVSFQVPTFYWRETIWAGNYENDIRNSEIVLRRRFKGNVPGSTYYKQIIPWSIFYNTLENKGRDFPISCKISTDKFTGIADGQNRSNLFRDDYAIRLPETILLRAEAKQRNGDKPGAASDVNLLRKRANCTYMVTPAEMDDKFSTILDERARELMYEEHRWNTLLRMGGSIATDRIRQLMLWDTYKSSYNRQFNLLPIPQGFIDVNTGNKIDQNSGW
jgi:hypothetical protein